MTCTHKNKVVATCPECNKKIFLHHLLEAKSQASIGPNSPLMCLTMLHGTKKSNRHALTLFVDKDMRVRGTQLANAVLVTRK